MRKIFKKKWIKAYNCYVCNTLFSPEYQGGYLVMAKKYAILSNPSDIAICRDCAERIANQIKKEKQNEPNDI